MIVDLLLFLHHDADPKEVEAWDRFLEMFSDDCSSLEVLNIMDRLVPFPFQRGDDLESFSCLNQDYSWCDKCTQGGCGFHTFKGKCLRIQPTWAEGHPLDEIVRFKTLDKYLTNGLMRELHLRNLHSCVSLGK